MNGWLLLTIIGAVSFVAFLILTIIVCVCESKAEKVSNYQLARTLDNTGMVTGIISVVCFFLLFIAGLVSLITHFSNKKYLHDWVHQREMIEYVMNNSKSDSYEHAGLLNKVLEYNESLEEAKSKLDYWGYWSGWYPYRDELNKLEYIIITGD